VENIGQLTIFVEDERSAINWLRNFLKTGRLTVTQDISRTFMQQLKCELEKMGSKPPLKALARPEFSLLRRQMAECPARFTAYLSTQFKELRNLPKDSRAVEGQGQEPLVCPRPEKERGRGNAPQQAVAGRILVVSAGRLHAARVVTANKGQTLPGLTVPRPKIPKAKSSRNSAPKPSASASSTATSRRITPQFWLLLT
jgi:hypothetical protein